MRRNPGPLLWLAAAGLVAGLAAGCGGSQAEPAGENTPPRPVGIVEVSAAAPATRLLPARVVASTSTPLAFEVGGRLLALELRAGQPVAAGEVLARLDPTDYQLALRDARARLARLLTEEQRKQALFEEEILAGAAAEQLSTDITLARVAVELAERNLAHTTLRAPFAARVARRLAESFATVAAGEPVLLLQESATVDIAAQLPARLAATLPLDATLAASALLDGEPLPLQLRYHEHATEADPLTGTYRVLFRAPTPEAVRLLPGMALELRLALPAGPDQQRSRLPLQSLQADASGAHFVWRVAEGQSRDDGAIERLPVTVERLEQDSVVLDRLLPEGTRVVTAGARFLRDGDRVRPLAD